MKKMQFQRDQTEKESSQLVTEWLEDHLFCVELTNQKCCEPAQQPNLESTRYGKESSC